MNIEVKAGVDKAKVGAAQKAMDAAKARDFAHAKELKAQREALGAKKGEGRTAGYSEDAVMAAVAAHGPGVLSDKRFWKEVKVENPWLCADGTQESFDSPNGRRNKYGVVKEKWIKGVWHVWDKEAGCWVPKEETK